MGNEEEEGVISAMSSSIEENEKHQIIQDKEDERHKLHNVRTIRFGYCNSCESNIWVDISFDTKSARWSTR